MDFRIIPESLPDSAKTGYLLRDMSLSEVVRITGAACKKMDYGARNTHKIELWVRNEYDKQGNIDYLKHMINCGKLRYKDILDIFKFYNPFFELDPSRPIDWLDTMMKEKKKEEVFLTDDFDYVPVPKKITITNPRWEHKDATRKKESPKKAAFDDTVILMADVTGVPENGLVTFEIFDISVKPPKNAGNAQGKNVGGVAKGEWVVSDKTSQGIDVDLEFQATAKSRTSARCKIPLNQLNSWGICRSKDKLPITLRTFFVYKEQELVFTGKTGEEGEINVPFSYSDEYQFCLREK
ncbi:MAG: hypothetical protein GX639_17900 [Fibrobacter sp.]|nr:hypothetical protein [Fibrobacter sp.]